MKSQPSNLVSLSPDTYRWKRSQTDPRIIQRAGNGAEAIVGMKELNSIGQYDLYLLTTLRLCDLPTSTTLSLSTLKMKIQSVLLELRFQHPDIACTAIWNEKGAPIFQYVPPADDNDALTWAQNSVQTRATPKTGYEMRAEIEKRRQVFKNGSSKPVMIYAIADVANENTTLTTGTTIDLLMHMNHLYWDGMGSRIFAGDLLRGLTKLLDVEHKIARYNWGAEITNLTIPVLDAIAIDLDSIGDDFNAACKEYDEGQLKNHSSWGLEYKVQHGTPRTIFHTFTVLESNAMINTIKRRLGPGFTITHLGHAATLLALLKANPPHDIPDNQASVMTTAVNGRPWLHDNHMGDRYGIVQSGALVEFENLKSYMVDKNDKDALMEALERGCISAKESSDKWIKSPYQLALGIHNHNSLAAFLTSNPMPYSKTASPMFISDGIIDRCIPGELTHPTTGETVMSVENVAFFLDTYLPFMALRLDSWKDASTVSICYNDGNYTTAEATNFLDDFTDYMLAFIGEA